MNGQPVGYQLRHREFGVFQGECMGMGFWHPMSDMPEQGILRFTTYEQVAGYRAFLASSSCSSPLALSDLTIEPFDSDLADVLAMSDVDATL